MTEHETRYRRILETTSEGYWLLAPESWRILEVNDSLCRLLGATPQQLLHRSILDFVCEESRTAFQQNLEALSNHPTAITHELKLRASDGRRITVHSSTGTLHDEHGVVTQLFSLLSVLPAGNHSTQELRLAATFFETTSEAITITDTRNRIVAVNPAFCWITGYSEEEVLGRDPSLLSSGRHSAAFYRAMWETLQRLGRWQGEIWNRRKNGEVYPEWLSIVAIRDEHGNVMQHMAIFSDITRRKQDEKKIWHQANFDALTGLPNRTLFLDRLGQAMHQAHRDQRQLALMFIDLDRFKYVNDTHGHAAGDQLLREAARRIRASVTESDTVARLGGDEFTVVLGNFDAILDVEMIADQILQALAQPFDIDGHEAFVSGSVGITLYPDDASELEQLLRNADSAMYRAKEAGRNTFRYFTLEMNDAARRRLRLEHDLRRAVEKGEIQVHFQPILNSAGRVVGAEALARWHHHELGMIAPDEFIPLAEDIGIIPAIEQWVMQLAVGEASQWTALGAGTLFVSVNISTLQCKNNYCYDFVRELLGRSHIKPAQLKLEITERVMMEDSENVISLLSSIRTTGIQLAIDDFGTGFSSLSYLKRFPADVLKIDRSFVRDLPEDRDNVGLVEAIVAMAKSLGLKLVAEGVETHEQLAFLHSLGVDMVQGYYYSPALTADQFRAYVLINNSSTAPVEPDTP
ncbi:MAG TPA: EAL domain-containing protein [Gammaproteobacteria bacterium]